MYKVLIEFTDKYSRVRHSVGDLIELQEGRAVQLIDRGIVEASTLEKKEVTISTEKVERKQNHKPKKESK